MVYEPLAGHCTKVLLRILGWHPAVCTKVKNVTPWPEFELLVTGVPWQARRTMPLSASDVLLQSNGVRVLAVFCADVAVAYDELRSVAEEVRPAVTLVTLRWRSAPSLARELYEIRDAFAEAAGDIWPAWYLTAERRCAEQSSASVKGGNDVARSAQRIAGASTGWLRRAWRKCERGQSPRISGMSAAEQVRQLALAIDHKSLVCVLSVESAEGSPARVRGLAHAADWVSQQTCARTVLMVPEAWSGHPELDRVSYGALHLQTEAAEDSSGLSGGASAELRKGKEGANRPLVVVEPVIGRPHPASEAEQIVYQRLQADSELSSLFRFNEPLEVYGGLQVRVDAVWSDGGVVIEIDGADHRSQHKYIKDRERDYRLTMSGYTVLRVTNDEVFLTPDSVVDKIRNVVGRVRAPFSVQERAI